jgi:transcriptional regulator with XRE-family HTH domain
MSSTILHPRSRAVNGRGATKAPTKPAKPARVLVPAASAPDTDEARHPFLAALGARVRALRARRGITRRALAASADVSERHLANLEYGLGNASILILLQVAQCAAVFAGRVDRRRDDEPRPSGCCCANCWRAATRRRCAACASPSASCSAPAGRPARAAAHEARAWR